MFSRLARSSVALGRSWGRPIQSAAGVGRRNFSSRFAADFRPRRLTERVSCAWTVDTGHWARLLRSTQRIRLVNSVAH